MKKLFKQNKPVDPGPMPPPPPDPPRSINSREFYIVFISLLLLIVISLYHISREGFLGLSVAKWSVVWVICENGILLLFSILGGIYFLGLIRKIFRWVFTPYFIVKLVYQFSCFAGVYIFSSATWEVIWSFICVAIIVTGIFLCIRKISNQ
jgi:hypothetical protein